MALFAPDRLEILARDRWNEPIDAYSISGDSELHSAAAVIIASQGHFALRRRYGERRGETICPPFNLSGEVGVAVWWRTRPESARCADFWGWAAQEKRGIADALESVRLEAPEISVPMDFVEACRQLASEYRAAIQHGA